MAFSKKYKKRALELYDEHGAMKAVFKNLESEFKDIIPPDERTIRRWNEARPVYLANERITTNPIILASIKKHQRELAKVAKLLLDNDLDLIVPIELLGEIYYAEELDKDKYKLFKDGWVTKLFLYNLENAREHFRPLDTVDMFEEHFKYETTSGKSLNELMKEQPFELMKLLQTLLQRRMFKGTCAVCRDWM